MELGFACVWERVPERSWSGTPWGLRTALERRAGVVDLGVRYSASRKLWKYAYVRRRHGRWATTDQWSPTRDRMVQRELEGSLRRASVDAVLEIGDLARLDAPFYIYQDLSFDVLARYYDSSVGVPGLEGINRGTIERRRERQHRIYEAAAGIFAMSEWFADTLVEWSGIPREKVAVIPAGLNSVDLEANPSPESGTTAKAQGPAKLLFVGRDFFRKGGDVVVKALVHLRREYSPDVRLTVAGPEKWPLPGKIPEGVSFLGGCTSSRVAQLYREHDLFVMPSHFEAYGIVFREALASGVPIIGRDAFAMPEVVEPGQNGALVKSEDPKDLASTIVQVLEDSNIRQHTSRTAKAMRGRFSWDTAAKRMLKAMES